MDIFGVLLLIGGLALFLYGMTEMGDGLEKVSGSKLKSILERLTSNKYKGVLLGALVTAVIQSSSATSVMVVGLVNSGIMKLTQAVGVIMGANIGTTVTAWVLSLTGIQSDSIFINLLKPSSFAPILAVIGIAFIMFSNSERKKDIGKIFLGFTVLMVGMDLMSSAVAPLAEVPEFMSILLKFSNPFLGMLAGAVLTAIIQSSSASIGILQALSLTGAVNYGVAIPVIMGQNIGTCITAILSGIGANRNAKRAAAIHLYFNIIGTVLFMLVFYGINSFVNFDFLNNHINAAGIAVIHTIFNVLSTLVLLPFSEQLVKLATLTIKDDKEEEANEFQMLDVRFVETPGYAINLSKDMTDRMAELSKDVISKAIGLLSDYDSDSAKEVMALEDRIDNYEDKIGGYLLKVSSKDITKRDSNLLTLILHSLNDYERIADHGINIVESAKEMHEKGIMFSDDAGQDLEVIIRAVNDILDRTFDALVSLDSEKAKIVEPLEEVINSLQRKIKKRHIARLQDGTCTPELGFILSDITTSLERIADHCSNVAVYIIQLNNDGFDTHDYLEQLKHEDNEKFKEQYRITKKQYKLSKINSVPK